MVSSIYLLNWPGEEEIFERKRPKGSSFLNIFSLPVKGIYFFELFIDGEGSRVGLKGS
jgi:hypothetical protein